MCDSDQPNIKTKRSYLRDKRIKQKKKNEPVPLTEEEGGDAAEAWQDIRDRSTDGGEAKEMLEDRRASP